MLYLTGQGQSSIQPCFPNLADKVRLIPDFALQRTFEWETATARLAMPDDTGSVAVVDGGEYNC